MSAIPLCPTLNLGLDFLSWRESLEANSSPLAGHNEGKTFMNSHSIFDVPTFSLYFLEIFKRRTSSKLNCSDYSKDLLHIFHSIKFWLVCCLVIGWKKNVECQTFHRSRIRHTTVRRKAKRNMDKSFYKTTAQVWSARSHVLTTIQYW